MHSLPAGIVCCAASQTRLRRTRLGTAYDPGQAGLSAIDGNRKKPIIRVYPEKSPQANFLPHLFIVYFFAGLERVGL